jgi:plastocyanin
MEILLMANQTVSVDDPMTFNPQSVSINAGETVTWNWTGSGHSVTSDDGSWDSDVQSAPFTFSQTFPTAGSFDYYCKVHGAAGRIGMWGTVVVT